MASRIANRVAEMAENMTFVEREKYVSNLLSSPKWPLSMKGRYQRTTITLLPQSNQLTYLPNRPQSPPPAANNVASKPAVRKPPRKLEMRIPNSGASPTNITFSAPFLDNTLSKLLTLQNRMLKVSNDIAASEDVDDQTKQEQFAQSAELSRIIALICAEKARQGA